MDSRIRPYIPPPPACSGLGWIWLGLAGLGWLAGFGWTRLAGPWPAWALLGTAEGTSENSSSHVFLLFFSRLTSHDKIRHKGDMPCGVDASLQMGTNRHTDTYYKVQN